MATINENDPHELGLVKLCEDAMRPGLRRIVAWSVIAWFLLAIAGEGVLDLLWPWPVRAPIGREKVRIDRERAAARFGDGSLARMFEQDVRSRSRLRSATLPYYASALYKFLEEADPEVLTIGREGWIFQAERLRAKPGPVESIVRLPAACVSALNRRFAACGTKLVVLAIPRKEELYQDFVRNKIRDPRPELYPAFHDCLVERSVLAPDLASAFRASTERTFLKTDTHWSPHGVAIAAEAVARAAGLLVPEPDRLTSLVPTGELLHEGDLLRMGGALRSDDSGPEWVKERAGMFRVIDRRTSNQITVADLPKTGDFGVAGTSYTLNGDLLQRYLIHFTDKPWWVSAAPAVGPIEPLKNAIRRMLASALPKVLVWEFPDPEIFCSTASFEKLGPAIAALPDGGPSVVAELAGAGPPELSPAERLNIGVARQIGPGSFEAWADVDRFIHPNDGVLSVRFRGRVEGARVMVGVHTGLGSMEAEWESGRDSICLPLVGSATGRKVHLSIHGPFGPAKVRLDAIELVTDLDLAAAVAARPDGGAESRDERKVRMVFTPPVPVRQRGAVLLDLAAVPGGAYPLTVRVETVGGGTPVPPVEIPGGRGRPTHTVLIGLGQVAGRAVEAISITSAGNVTPAIVRRALIAAPRDVPP